MLLYSPIGRAGKSRASGNAASSTAAYSDSATAAAIAASPESDTAGLPLKESHISAGAAATPAEGKVQAKHVSSVGLPLPAHLEALEARMQQSLKETRMTLNHKTGGSLPEYGEAGSLPMLCGTWQTLPESPAFAASTEITFYRESDSEATAALETHRPAPYVTCQWLPQQQIHIVETRQFRLSPQIVQIDRQEFHSKQGCELEALRRERDHKGITLIEMGRDDVKGYLNSASLHPTAPEPPLRASALWLAWLLSVGAKGNLITWESAVVTDYPPQQGQQEHQGEAKQEEKPPQQEQEGTCPADGNKDVWLSAVSFISVDVARSCTKTQADSMYSWSSAAEFLVEPQGVAVSHEAIKQRRRVLGLIRLKALKATVQTHWGPRALTAFRDRHRRVWSPRLEFLYQHTWKQFLSAADPWARSLCRWEVLREACFEPPLLELAEALHRLKGNPPGAFVKGSLNSTSCKINHLDLQLSRHPNGAEFLTVPLYPYNAATADIISLRKISGCNDGRDIVKAKGAPRRHTMLEEQAGGK
ncbi:RON10, related protein [Cyclospora cayetanensis]|uniref:RON10, related protein n=1 Tax=Cyclospora cayetanensis TaxID=88456 RepID=A0A1D3CVT7_9EIME|nr:RON10, related protein [Cyclospora cayetanensis]